MMMIITIIILSLAKVQISNNHNNNKNKHIFLQHISYNMKSHFEWFNIIKNVSMHLWRGALGDV